MICPPTRPRPSVAPATTERSATAAEAGIAALLAHQMLNEEEGRSFYISPVAAAEAQRIVNRSVRPCHAHLNRTGRNIPAFTLGTASQALPDATPQRGPIEHDATTDMLVAELRQVIAELRHA